MTASRESHDTYVVGVDMPCRSRVAHGAYGLLGIAHGDGAVAARHAVGQHEEGDALIVEPLGPVVPLMLCGQMAIATAWAVDDGPSRRVLWQIDHHVGLTVGGDVYCELTCCRRHIGCHTCYQQDTDQ